MTIEPRPLTAEEREGIEAEHANCPTPGCTPRDLYAALLHAEAQARNYFDEYQCAEERVATLEAELTAAQERIKALEAEHKHCRLHRCGDCPICMEARP